MRVGRTSATVLASATVALLLVPASALAHERGGRGSTGGVAFGFARNAYLTGSFHARQNSADPYDAGGYAKGRPTAPGLHDLRLANGPVRCVQIRGNRVGILYRNDSTSQPPAERGFDILITAQDNGPGDKDLIGLEEAPPGVLHSCEPTLATMPLDSGDITVLPNP
jgi:hypothetical protein